MKWIALAQIPIKFIAFNNEDKVIFYVTYSSYVSKDSNVSLEIETPIIVEGDDDLLELCEELLRDILDKPHIRVNCRGSILVHKYQLYSADRPFQLKIDYYAYFDDGDRGRGIAFPIALPIEEHVLTELIDVLKIDPIRGIRKIGEYMLNKLRMEKEEIVKLMPREYACWVKKIDAEHATLNGLFLALWWETKWSKILA